MPDGVPVPADLRSESSHFPARPHSPVRSSTVIPRSPDSQVRSSPSAEPSLRVRSISPPAVRSVDCILGYGLQELKFVRLIPDTNSNRSFEVRRYIFSRDEPIYVRGRGQVLMPMPTEEQTILLTSNGDVFAIFGDDTFLRGIYTIRTYLGNKCEKRVKMNMYSGMITDMTKQEIRETPLGKSRPISKNFRAIMIHDFRSHHE